MDANDLRIVLQPSEDSLTGTMALVPEVVDAVRLPVVAAGGIGDAREIVAAFALGAEGVQMGTAFLACGESGANALHRHALLSGQALYAIGCIRLSSVSARFWLT
jgi:nitronate monooxygenase